MGATYGCVEFDVDLPRSRVGLGCQCSRKRCLGMTRLLFENTFLEQRYIEKNRATRSNREKMRNILPIGRGQQFFCLRLNLNENSPTDVVCKLILQQMPEM